MAICTINGCDSKMVAKGLCTMHYQRVKKFGNPQADIPKSDKRGSRNPKWRGGEAKMKDGRVLIYNPDYDGPKVSRCYVLRYRMMMEEHLGRRLKPKEVVHHINGKNDDDRIENLELIDQSQHASIHYKTRQIDKSTGRLM